MTDIRGANRAASFDPPPASLPQPERPEPQRPRLIPANVAFLFGGPLLAIIGTPLWIAHFGLHWSEVVAAVALWWITGLGITAGYHRLFSHRAWRATTPVRALLAIAGALAAENSVITWSAAHRYHHRDVDSDDDPYSIRRGFFYAHMGWVLVEGPRHGDLDNVADLQRDPVCRWQHRHYWKIALFGNLAICTLLGLLSGHVLGMIVIAGWLRIVEARLEQALADLKAARREFGRQCRERLDTAAIRYCRAAVRRAHADARRALREWETRALELFGQQPVLAAN